MLDLEVIYKGRYDIEYVRVLQKMVSTYYFGGLPLFDAIRGVKAQEPTLSAQFQPHVKVAHHPNMSIKPLEKLVLSSTPLPTSVAKVGEKMIHLGGYQQA